MEASSSSIGFETPCKITEFLHNCLVPLRGREIYRSYFHSTIILFTVFHYFHLFYQSSRRAMLNNPMLQNQVISVPYPQMPPILPTGMSSLPSTSYVYATNQPNYAFGPPQFPSLAQPFFSPQHYLNTNFPEVQTPATHYPHSPATLSSFSTSSSPTIPSNWYDAICQLETACLGQCNAADISLLQAKLRGLQDVLKLRRKAATQTTTTTSPQSAFHSSQATGHMMPQTPASRNASNAPPRTRSVAISTEPQRTAPLKSKNSRGNKQQRPRLDHPTQMHTPPASQSVSATSSSSSSQTQTHTTTSEPNSDSSARHSRTQAPPTTSSGSSVDYRTNTSICMLEVVGNLNGINFSECLSTLRYAPSPLLCRTMC